MTGVLHYNSKLQVVKLFNFNKVSYHEGTKDKITAIAKWYIRIDSMQDVSCLNELNFGAEVIA